MANNQPPNSFSLVPMCADLLHRGHLNILKYSRSLEVPVKVLLMTDQAMISYKCAPLMDYEQREEMLLITNMVDEIIRCDGPQFYKKFILDLRPLYFVHGTDWNTGIQSPYRIEAIEAMEKIGGTIKEPPYTPGISSTLLRNSARSNAVSMLMDFNPQQLSGIGANILRVLNNVKRPTHIAADELGVSESDLQMVLNGEGGVSLVWTVMSRIMKIYPVKFCDVWIDADDTKYGVSSLSAESSKSTSRTTYRKNMNNELSPYYEYRDSAMSRLSYIKPEWIKELRFVENNDPYNPNVAYNNGHFNAQTTFFVGPVNFYYEINKKKYCFEANTGDTNYISPFVPHSFASRDKDNLGLIIAVTYETTVQLLSSDITSVNIQKIHCLNVGDGEESSDGKRRALLIQRMMRLESMGPNDFIKKLELFGVSNERSQCLLQGDKPSEGDIDILSDVFCVQKSFFLIDGVEDLVLTNRFNPAMFDYVNSKNEILLPPRLTRNSNDIYFYPDNATSVTASYIIQRLVRSKVQSFLKVFALFVLKNTFEKAGAEIIVEEYQFIYNYGKTAIILEWGDNFEYRTVIKCEGSAAVLPCVKHRFSCFDNVDYYQCNSGNVGNDSHASLVIVRVPGKLESDFHHELNSYNLNGIKRVAFETLQWYQGR